MSYKVDGPCYESSGYASESPATLRSIMDIRPLYFLPRDPLIEEVLIPGFKTADKVDCMVGFFSSEVLGSIAPGLATYLSRTENSFRLIINPILRPEDLDEVDPIV